MSTRVITHNSELEEKPKLILLVEDSITTRVLEKNILENAGFRVKTAVDGVDAISVLNSDSFDLVVSDIDMPRMDGFALTQNIKTSKDHSNIPVVLVSSLEKQDDKERGIDVGADAYIVKSNFEQSDFINTIKKFL